MKIMLMAQAFYNIFFKKNTLVLIKVRKIDPEQFPGPCPGAGK